MTLPTAAAEPQAYRDQAEPTPVAGIVHAVFAADHALVVLGGDIDLAMEDRLARLAQRLLDWGLPAMVDTTDVVFADSTLINFLAVLAGRGPAPVAVCNPPQALKHLIRVFGLESTVVAVDAPHRVEPPVPMDGESATT